MNPQFLRDKGVTILEVRRATLSGYDLCFSTKTGDWKHAMIDLKESEEASVEGALYKITDDILRIFDGHEEVAQGKHKRIEVQVQTEEGTLAKALTFVSPIKEGDFTPSAEYLKVIVEGAKLQGLSKGYIDHILSFGYPQQGR